jgi:hypothetical protein
MENQRILSLEEVSYIVTQNIRNLKNVVGFTKPYLRKEDDKVFYMAPLLVCADNRTIDTVGIVEIKLDAYSGKVMKMYSEKEIENKVRDVLSRRAEV